MSILRDFAFCFALVIWGCVLGGGAVYLALRPLPTVPFLHQANGSWCDVKPGPPVVDAPQDRYKHRIGKPYRDGGIA